MLVGHTKFAPDRFFGQFKRQFRRATVDTMHDHPLLERTFQIQQLILLENVTVQYIVWLVIVSWRLLPDHPQHYNVPPFYYIERNIGKITCEESIEDSSEAQIALLKKGVIVTSIFRTDLPTIVTPSGMDVQRRWYLYEQVRPFCHSNLHVHVAMDITCHKPIVSKLRESSL